ncbi:hypothetical protein A3B45_02670 [Candidatus Daviesbacteria bacterium RIFCSPLOWO2_01_FULL_39_12]|uniref:Uncharacterized protein n=1 Tax=Candidatus Daviesbacteria bacterium RIFCSPLOWO2_01_FULL_39_12 TaxID=1797785 RepID=A0A1F5KSV6_9BACT|nr:MAG: hypothetical protein A3B45_02670 [Candidatus Daviesbacteria bacterium RIFCSPLOWO2_01_FULL_39_12]
MNDWTSNKKTLILIGVLILILVGILLVETLPKKEPGVPGDTISPLFKTKIGQTTDNNLSSQPDLLKKTAADGQTVYTFKPTSNLVGNQVITEGGKAVFEKGTILEQQSKLLLYSDYVSKYGKPETAFAGSKTYGKFEKTYTYASLGFALKVNPFTQEVDEVQKFAPTTTEEYLKKWGDDITSFVEIKEQF